MGRCRGTSAIVEANLLNAVVVKHREVVAVGSTRRRTLFADWMVELHAETQRAEGYSLEVLSGPTLVVKACQS